MKSLIFHFRPIISSLKERFLVRLNLILNFENYGYEDLLFAMDLKFEDIKIHHIDNPIFNNDLETNEIYLKKAEESVESLAKMLKTESLKPKISEIKLVKAYNFLQKTYLSFIFQPLFSFMEEKIKKNLISNNPNLRNLDLYKLGLLLRKMK